MHHMLFHLILRGGYLSSLWSGILPAPLDWHKVRCATSRIYLSYSFLIHCLYAAGLQFFFIHYLDTSRRISEQSMLKWIYLLTGIAKISAVGAIGVEVWVKRHQALKVLKSYRSFARRYRHLKLSNPAHTRLHYDIERLIIGKFFCGKMGGLMNSLVHFLMLPTHESQDLLAAFLNCMLSFFLIAGMDLFFFMLSQLYDQFMTLNLSLTDLRVELRRLARYKKQHPDSIAGVWLQTERLSDRMLGLNTMHMECFVLSRRIFQLNEVGSVAIMLELFSGNVAIIYHAIIFETGNVSTSSWADLFGRTRLVLFYAEVFLLLAIIHKVIVSCNDTNQLLRDCNELLELKDCKNLTRAIDQFSCHLSTHKLKYKVCGLIEINKETSLKYFLSGFVKITILLQFDVEHKFLKINT